MRVPEDETQHELAEELPLMTDSGTVTAVRHLDEDRNDEVEAVVRSLAEVHDAPEAYRGGDVDWRRLRAALPDDSESLTDRLDALRERYERAYPSLVHLAVRPEDETARAGELDFVPGQYVSIGYDGMTRPYSVASSPNADELEFCVRRVPHGNLSETICADVEPGDEMTVRGPNGEFVLDEPSGRDMVFLATGTGVAPLRSMIDYTFEEGRDEVDGERRDVWLFLGCSWADDLPFHGEFRALDAERGNFHYVPTVSREEYLTDWDGETAYIQYAMAKHLDRDAVGDLDGPAARYLDHEPATGVDARLDPENVEVYACGVSAMVQSLLDTVEAVGVPERAVAYEGYG